MTPLRVVVVVALILIAGCAGLPLPSPPTTSPSPVADQCHIEDLTFAEDGGRGWAQNRVRVNFTLTGTADLFLVVQEQGDTLGVRHVESETPRIASWVPISLRENLSGIHRIRVLAYGDRDRNDHFDKRLDHICEARFGAVQTTLITRNFSEFAERDGTRSLLAGPRPASLDGGTG